MILKNKDIKIKHKIAILSAFFALILLLIANFIIFRTAQDIKNIKQEIINEQVAMEQRLFEDRNKAIIQNKLNKIEPLMDALNSIFVDKNRAIEFFTSLEDIAREHDVVQTISLSEIGGDKNNSTYANNPVSIKCEGEYRNIFNYLSGLEKLNYYINIGALSLSKTAAGRQTTISGEENQTPPAVTMNITAETFWKN